MSINSAKTKDAQIAKSRFESNFHDSSHRLAYISKLKPKSNQLPYPLSVSDFVSGISQLAIISVIETTGIVEAIHRDIVLRPLGLLNHRYGQLFWHKGISRRVYDMVKDITSLVGSGLTLGIGQYSRLTRQLPAQPLPPQLMCVVNIINGVLGDHLVANNNPLALPMTLYQLDKHNGLEGSQLSPILSLTSDLAHSDLANHTLTDNALADCCINLATSDQLKLMKADKDKITGRVIVLLHGLCMDHLNWQPDDKQALGHRVLSHLPEATVLYLNYNTGQRISTNGRQFAKMMHSLTIEHPDITEINLIGHSMGGLVSRSALYYGCQKTGCQKSDDWVVKANKLITLGTPHHGALLERIGDFVQQSIAKLPFASALAKLGDIRSVGIIDLRYGSIRDEDWQSLPLRQVLPDSKRYSTPLPDHVAGYFLAGSLSQAEDSSRMGALLGDGLVNIHSALGEHTKQHTLQIAGAQKAVFYEINHLELLTDKRVLDQVITWLIKK